MRTTARFGTVIVIAKEPVPGRVKTRLVPPLTHQQAAELAAAAIADTLAVAIAVPATTHLLAWDGHAAGWLPAGWSITPQPKGDLDVRLVAAFDAAASAGSTASPAPAILVGMDTPQLQAAQLTAFDPDRYDAGIGLARDGGYWAIGFRDPGDARAVISGVPMSRSDTGQLQLARMRDAGLRVQLLDELTDVDTYADAVEVAATAPASAFAQAMSAIGAVRPSVLAG